MAHHRLLGGVLSAAMLAAVAVTPGTAVAQGAPSVSQPRAGGTTYYVDCAVPSNGSGTQDSPFNSLAAANGVTLTAGDQLLFKRGTTCTSQVQNVDGQNVKAGLRVVDAHGTTEAPVVVGAYGDESDPKPAIAGDGVSETVLVKNSDHITVANLDVSNKDAEGQSDKYMRRGIVVMNDNAGVLRDITVTGNDVHDVRGEFQKDLGGSGGIQLETYARSIPVVGPTVTKSSVRADSNRAGMESSYFDGVTVSSNTVTNATRSGINMSTDWRCREDVRWDCGVPSSQVDRFPWTPNRNLAIRGNTVRHIGGDGIIVQMSDGAVVEGNLVDDAANREVSGQNNAAVWNWNSDNTLFQYNEVSNTGRKSNNDGTAWDFDYGTRNTVYQYNYSHDNAGGSLLVCACAGWMTQWGGTDASKNSKGAGYAEGATFRYNVSVNDGVSAAAEGDSNRLMFAAGVTDMSFYNNTIVLPRELATDGPYAGDGKTYQLTTNGDNGNIAFVNNLIVSPVTIADENGDLDSSTRHMTYGNNLYVGSDEDPDAWAQVGSNGNAHMTMDEYLDETGVDLDRVYDGDLSVLATLPDEAKGQGRPFAPKKASFAIENASLKKDALAARSFPTDFQVGGAKGNSFDGQKAVPSWSAPDIGAFQSTAADEDATLKVPAVKAGRATSVPVPGNATVRVTVPAGARLSIGVDNDRGYARKTDGTAGPVFVRTSNDASALRLENLGDEDADGVTVTTVRDLIWDGSFESHATNDDTDNGISPWTDASAVDENTNYDTSGWRKTVKQRSAKNQKDAVVSGEYAGRLSNKTTDAWNHARLNQRNIPAEPGATYRIGVWGTLGASSDGKPSALQVRVKSRNASSGAGGSFGQYSTTLLDIAEPAADAQGGTVYATGVFTVPESADPTGALWVSVSQANLGEGQTSYVDDVTIVPTDEKADEKPTTTYTKFLPIQDPGKSASDYFQPEWTDTDGDVIQAHGGQIIASHEKENGRTVYYWYGEDRTHVAGTNGVPGVHAYRSTDLLNWQDVGIVLRSVTRKAQLTDPKNKDFREYFNDLYGLTGKDGSVDTAKANAIFRHLNTDPDQDGDGTNDTPSAIIERPKMLYNEKNHQYVMWWHSDGSPTNPGSSYEMALAGVAVADSPAGPFRMVGAYRMPNRSEFTCDAKATPGMARDMTAYQDDDGTAYLIYSSEENRTLYVARLNDDYTNVDRTSDTPTMEYEYSESGRYPVVTDDGGDGDPVRGEDYQIVKQCAQVEAPAMFKQSGRYYIVASAATGWDPNSATYYTADSPLGTWTRGLDPSDAHENTNASGDKPAEGTDGWPCYGDTRRTTFGSQPTNVLPLDKQLAQYVYMGDRWKPGDLQNSPYVWLPLTFGENGALQMRNPAQQDARWSDGWDASYWQTNGGWKNPDRDMTWWAVKTALPEKVAMGSDPASVLPSTVEVQDDTSSDTTVSLGVTWSADLSHAGTVTVTGTLAGDDDFYPGRTFTRTVTVEDGQTPQFPWSFSTFGSKKGKARQTGVASFTVTDGANKGTWTNKDELTSVYRTDMVGEGQSVETTVSIADRGGNEDPRVGLALRNDLSAAGKGRASGYALLLLGAKGVFLQADTDGNGYIDKETQAVAVPSDAASIMLKAVRTGAGTVEGFWRASADDDWQSVGTVSVKGADDRLDAGPVVLSNNEKGSAVADFTDVSYSAEDDLINLSHQFCSSAAVSSYQTDYGSQPGTNACDGSLSTSWSNWNKHDASPWMNWTFDTKYQLDRLEFYLAEDTANNPGKPEAPVSQFRVQYLDEADKAWVDTDIVGTPSGSLTVPTVVDLSSLPPTKAVSLLLTYGPNQDYTKVAEVRVLGRSVAPAVDTSALQKAVDEAKALRQADYTADSWSTMQKALDAAEKLLDRDDATQDEVAQATADLTAAIAALVPAAPLVTAALQALVSAAQAMDLSPYTDSSAQAVRDALASAQDVLDAVAAGDASVTQDRINEAASELREALEALEAKPVAPVTAALEATVTAAKAVDLSLYTDASAQAVRDALADAQAVLDAVAAGDASVTQARVDDAASALLDALKALEAKPVAPVTAALEAAVTAAQAVDLSLYTDLSAQEVRSALADAQAVLDAVAAGDASVTQTTVDAAATALRKALEGLTPKPTKVDVTALKETVAKAEAEKLKAADYTEASWADVESALDAAKALLSRVDKGETVAQADVDAADAALTGAISRLVRAAKTDVTALRKAVAQAEGLKAADYTEASWSGVESALDAAKALLSRVDRGATVAQADVDAAAAALTSAIAQLKPAGSDGAGSGVGAGIGAGAGAGAGSGNGAAAGPESDSGSGTMARTGVDVGAIAGVVVLLLIAAGMVIVTRRRQ